MSELPFDDRMDEFDVQLQMFCHAPTKQAWDIIQALYQLPDVQLHPDFTRHHEKIKMFMAAVLSNHPDWATSEEHAQLLAQAKTRREWLLGPSGDSLRKVDLIWYTYFGTGDSAYPLKVRAMSDTLGYNAGLREVCVRTYCAIAQMHPQLAELAPELIKIGGYLEEERIKQQTA